MEKGAKISGMGNKDFFPYKLSLFDFQDGFLSTGI